MNIKMYVTKITMLVFALSLANISIAAQGNDIEHITVINNSDLSLMPTAEGIVGGCLGGSLPPFFDPIAPHTTRDVGIIFLKYSADCRFDVLPEPNIITYFQACHAVKANDTLSFTGKDFANLRCQIVA